MRFVTGIKDIAERITDRVRQFLQQEVGYSVRAGGGGGEGGGARFQR